MFSCCLTDNPISVFLLLHNTFRSRDLILGPLTDHVAHILPHFEYYTARDFIFRAKFKFFSFFREISVISKLSHSYHQPIALLGLCA